MIFISFASCGRQFWFDFEQKSKQISSTLMKYKKKSSRKKIQNEIMLKNVLGFICHVVLRRIP